MKSAQQRPVPGFSRYVVTENGEVFGRFGRQVKLEMLKGYLTFKAWSDDGRRIRTGVHQLVALAFLGPAPSPDHEVAHEDGDRTNNRSSNLSWKTAAENNADKKRHGTHQAGERHPRARLSAEAVDMIRSRYTGAPGQGDEMAKEFGVSKQHIRHVARGHRWNSAAGTRPAPVGHVAAQQRSEVDEQDSYDSIWHALQRIDTAAVMLPTFEVRHEGGIEAVTQNIVDAIYAAASALSASQPAPTQPRSEVDDKTRQIVAAAERLVRCKGRYHTEQNFRALAALFGVTVPESASQPAQAGDVLTDERIATLRSDAWLVFDASNRPQVVRDVIEWYDASLRALTQEGSTK